MVKCTVFFRPSLVAFSESLGGGEIEAFNNHGMNAR